MILHRIATGEGPQQSAADAAARIKGIELDAGLASLSAALLADALGQDFAVAIDTGQVLPKLL
ncbi:MAG: hypothetical protein K2W91_11715 [Novosphingobium sp.]|nr:hypothetical protein [Novosphingobium sp.]